MNYKKCSAAANEGPQTHSNSWVGVTLGLVTFPVTWLPLSASYSLVGSEMYSRCHFRHPTAASRLLPVKRRHFRVSSGHLWSRDVISCHGTASFCELQHCRKWNVQYMPVLGPHSHFQVTCGQMTPLPGHFRSPEVTWRHFLSHNYLLLWATAL